MREITFRGKTHDGMWIEGAYYHANKNYGDPDDVHCIIPTTENLDYEQALEYFIVDPATVGQCTGLKDKNGKRIFEGDIVKCKGEGRICKVGYYTSPAYCGYDLYAVGNLKALPPHSWEFLDGLEVIGNIHDNPELLEVR